MSSSAAAICCCATSSAAESRSARSALSPIATAIPSHVPPWNTITSNRSRSSRAISRRVSTPIV